MSESLVFGWPHILVPFADSFDSMREMQENEQSLFALCQVQSFCFRAQYNAHKAWPAAYASLHWSLQHRVDVEVCCLLHGVLHAVVA